MANAVKLIRGWRQNGAEWVEPIYSDIVTLHIGLVQARGIYYKIPNYICISLFRACCSQTQIEKKRNKDQLLNSSNRLWIKQSFLLYKILLLFKCHTHIATTHMIATTLLILKYSKLWVTRFRSPLPEGACSAGIPMLPHSSRHDLAN